MKIKNKEVLGIIIFALFMILISFLIYVIPRFIAFRNYEVIFIKRNINILVLVLSLFLFVINFAIIFDKLIHAISKNSNAKLALNQKKNKRRIHRDYKIFIFAYFICSSLLILGSILNICFSRYVLTSDKIIKYNFLNINSQEIQIKEISHIEIGTDVYTGKSGTSLNLYISFSNPINERFIEGENLSSKLKLMKHIKNSNCNVTVNKNKINNYLNKINFNEWNELDRELFQDIFELKF